MSPAQKPGAEPSDEQLLQQFQEGHAAAFEQLLSRYRRPIYSFVLRSIRERDYADELHQEVFMRVVQRAGDFRGQSKFSTWLFTIARNLCIDHSRKMSFRRHRSLDAPSGTDVEGGGATLLDKIEGGEASADRRAIGREVKARIQEAVESLPEQQREVFLMRQVSHLPFKEIAQVVGVPENTVKSRMRYALERLQDALAEYREYAQKLG